MACELYLNIYLTIHPSFMVCELKVVWELRGELQVKGGIQEGFPGEGTQVVLFLALQSLNITGSQSCPKAMPLQSSDMPLYTLILLPSVFLSSTKASHHVHTIQAPFVHPFFSASLFYK